jgi:hypothetical protein
MGQQCGRERPAVGESQAREPLGRCSSRRARASGITPLSPSLELAPGRQAGEREARR